MPQVGHSLCLVNNQQLILSKGLCQNIQAVAFEDIAQNPVVARFVTTFEAGVWDEILDKGGLSSASRSVNNQNPAWFKLLSYEGIAISFDQHIALFC